MNKQELGKYGEKKAVEYLKKQGYKILERNFRFSRGEIDIIALDDDFLIFVEVKLRRTTAYGSPQAAINYRKQEKIKRTAQYYLLINNQSLHININKKNLRFDVISIQIKDGKGYLKHFKNAF